MLDQLDECRHLARWSANKPRSGGTRSQDIPSTDPDPRSEPSWTRILGLDFGADSTPEERPVPPSPSDYEVAKRIGYVVLVGVLTMIGAMAFALLCFSHT